VPDFLQLERRGNVFTMSVARFGELLTVSRLEELPLGDEVYVGLFLCSHNRTWSRRRSSGRARDPAGEGRLHALPRLHRQRARDPRRRDGRRQVVHRSAEPFEAPNWTPTAARCSTTRAARGEGAGGSTASTSPRASRRSIDTGFAIRNNNDHVLSFDGTMLASATRAGRAALDRLHAARDGRTPKRSRRSTPSYLHGWSPDGKRSSTRRPQRRVRHLQIACRTAAARRST
jgi:hypothetical protein